MATADDEVTQVAAAGGGGDEATAVAAPARRPSRLRAPPHRPADRPLLLGVVVSGLTMWTHYTVMNTDGYMRIVGPIGKDPQAIQNLSTYIAGQAVAATDLQQRVSDALPDKAKLFAGPITGASRGLHHQGHQEGAELAQGLRAVAQDQRGRPREDRRAAARRVDDRVHLRQRREAQPPAAGQPGARVGGRASCRAGSRAASPRPSSSPAPTRRPPSRRSRTGRASRCRPTSGRSPCSSPTRSGRRRRPSSGSTGSCGSSRSSPPC